jgi:alpha-N-acetylglucosamine transferase
MAAVTHQSISRYAKNIEADFLVITNLTHATAHWEKFRIYDLLNRYERILYIDTDVLIKRDCPNLFDIVPKDMIGAFNEGQYFDRKYKDYYNAGVMVIPKCRRNIFSKPESEQGNIYTFFEQNFINDRIHLSGYPVYNLSHKFNKMDFIHAPGHIIHKAGNLNALAELREMAGVLE